MSQSTPPVPLINPVLLERWTSVPETKPLGLDLTRQEWDLILAALLDQNQAVNSLATFAVSEAPNRDWSAYSAYIERNSNAQTRIIRFIETVMMKATHG